MKVRMCEIVQQMEYLDLDNLQKVLDGKKCISEWAYIIHGKDKKEDGSSVVPHIHLALKFDNSYDSKYICKWFDVPEQCVNKIKGKWVDILKYLTHKNAPNKYQYSDEDVICNFDYNKALEDSSKKVDKRKVEIMDKIVNGEIREYNYYEHMSIEEYDRYKKSIDNAFKYRVDKIKGVDRSMECIFISGDSGSGKTTMAKDMAKEKGLSYYVSSGSNDVLDDYKGQDCIILDDLRPSCMGLSDLLKMLDNNTASTVKSRYRNKVLECKLVIITTVLPLEEFFSHVFENEKEPVVQLQRRCRTYIKLTKKNMSIGMWKVDSKEYRWFPPVPNPVIAKYNVVDKTDEEMLEDIANLGSMFTGVVDTYKSNVEFYKRSQVEDDNANWEEM